MAEMLSKKCDDGPREESPVSESPSEVRGSGRVERAEEAEENTPSGWWGDWISIARDKSAEVLGMVKKDLDELSTAVKSEASYVINSTSTTLTKTLRLDEPDSTANTMKKSFSTFLDQVNTVLNPSPDDEDTEVFIITDGEPVPISRAHEILALQRLDATYIVSPEGESLERLNAWRKVHTFPSTAVLEKLLKNAPVLQDKYDRLVPAAVTEKDFWERYLYRKALLEDRLCNPGAALTYLPSDPVVSSLLGDIPLDTTPDDSVKSNCGSTPPPELDEGDVSVTWDNDFDVDVELSEEQQTKLLEEYEAEIKSTSKPTKSKSSPVLNQPAKVASPKKVSQTSPKKNPKEIKTKSSETVANIQKTMGKILQDKRKNNVRTSPKSNLQCKMVEDHFKEKKDENEQKSLATELAEKVTMDSESSNTDEGWERFDDDVSI